MEARNENSLRRRLRASEPQRNAAFRAIIAPRGENAIRFQVPNRKKTEKTSICAENESDRRNDRVLAPALKARRRFRERTKRNGDERRQNIFEAARTFLPQTRTKQAALLILLINIYGIGERGKRTSEPFAKAARGAILLRGRSSEETFCKKARTFLPSADHSH